MRNKEYDRYTQSNVAKIVESNINGESQASRLYDYTLAMHVRT